METETGIVVELVRKARVKTIEILHAVPEHALYETHPPCDRTFTHTFLHIAEGEEGWLYGAFEDGGPKPEFINYDVQRDRMGILLALERSHQRMLAWIAAHPSELTKPLAGWARGKPALDRVVYLIGHEVNHQTQILHGLQRLGLEWDIFMPF